MHMHIKKKPNNLKKISQAHNRYIWQHIIQNPETSIVRHCNLKHVSILFLA